MMVRALQTRDKWRRQGRRGVFLGTRAAPGRKQQGRKGHKGPQGQQDEKLPKQGCSSLKSLVSLQSFVSVFHIPGTGEVIGHAGRIFVSLGLNACQGGAGFLGFDDAGGLAVHVEKVVGGAVGPS